MGSALQQPADNTEELNVINEIEVAMEAIYNQFYNSVIFEMANSKYVPAHKVLSRSMELRSSVTQDSKIVDEATNVANKFVEKSYASAIAGVVSLAMKALLGNTSASVSQKRDYAIAVGGLGGIVRVDYLVYLKSFSFDGILSTTKNIALYAAIISSADTAGLEENDIKALIDVNYGSEFGLQKKQYLYRIIMGEQIDEKEYENLFGKNQSDQRKVQAVPVGRTMKSQAYRENSPHLFQGCFPLLNVNQNFQNFHLIPIHLHDREPINFQINFYNNQTISDLREQINKIDSQSFVQSKFCGLEITKDSTICYQLQRLTQIYAAHQLNFKIKFFSPTLVQQQLDIVKYSKNIAQGFRKLELKFAEDWGEFTNQYIILGFISLDQNRKCIKIDRNAKQILLIYLTSHNYKNCDDFTLVPQIRGVQEIQNYRRQKRRTNQFQIQVQPDKSYYLNVDQLKLLLQYEKISEQDAQKYKYLDTVHLVNMQKVVHSLYEGNFTIDSIHNGNQLRIWNSKYFYILIRNLFQGLSRQKFGNMKTKLREIQQSENSYNLRLLVRRLPHKMDYSQMIRQIQYNGWTQLVKKVEQNIVTETEMILKEEEVELFRQKISSFPASEDLLMKIPYIVLTTNFYSSIMSIAKTLPQSQDLAYAYKKENKLYELTTLKNLALHYTTLPYSTSKHTYLGIVTKDMTESKNSAKQKYMIIDTPTLTTKNLEIAKKYAQEKLQMLDLQRGDKDYPLFIRMLSIEQNNSWRSIQHLSLNPQREEDLGFKQILILKQIKYFENNHNIISTEQLYESIMAPTLVKPCIIFFEPYEPPSHQIEDFIDKEYEILRVNKTEHLKVLIDVFKTSPSQVVFGIDATKHIIANLKDKYEPMLDYLCSLESAKDCKVFVYGNSSNLNIIGSEIHKKYARRNFDIMFYNFATSEIYKNLPGAKMERKYYDLNGRHIQKIGKH